MSEAEPSRVALDPARLEWKTHQDNLAWDNENASLPIKVVRYIRGEFLCVRESVIWDYSNF